MLVSREGPLTKGHCIVILVLIESLVILYFLFTVYIFGIFSFDCLGEKRRLSEHLSFVLKTGHCSPSFIYNEKEGNMGKGYKKGDENPIINTCSYSNFSCIEHARKS